MPEEHAWIQDRRRAQALSPVSGVVLRAGRDLAITFLGAVAAGATAAAGAVTGAVLGAAVGALGGIFRGATGRPSSAADVKTPAQPTPSTRRPITG